MKSFESFILESKKCPDGKYWCNDSKKCKKVPRGWYLGRGGYIEKDHEYGGESDSGGDGDGGGGE